MSATDLYGAVVTSVPFVLLTLVAESKLFGPQQGERRSKADYFWDRVFLFMLALGFSCSLYGLAVEDSWDVRLPAAAGLGLGVAGVFIHAWIRIRSLYRAEGEPPAT